MSDVEDIQTRLAASGALSTVTTIPNACHQILDLQKERHHALKIIAQLIDPSLDETLGPSHPGLIHRGVVVVRNMCAIQENGYLETFKQESKESKLIDCFGEAEALTYLIEDIMKQITTLKVSRQLSEQKGALLPGLIATCFMSFLLGPDADVDEDLDKLFSNAKTSLQPIPQKKAHKSALPSEDNPKEEERLISTPKKHGKKRSALSEPESSHASKRVKKNDGAVLVSSPQSKNDKRSQNSSNGVHQTSDDSYTPPIHESLQNSEESSKRKKKNPSRTKCAPPEETTSQRDSRTLFISNVSLNIVNNKGIQKQLKQHVLSSLEDKNPSIESLRVRSIPFSTPTEGKGKKRAAAIKGDLHEQGRGCNVYVVFGFGNLKENGEKTETGNQSISVNAAKVMDPYEAASMSAQALNGTMFLERRIRVAVASASFTPADSPVQAFDTRQTLFLGSLDFNVDEEDVRTLFERLSQELLAEEEEDSEPTADDSSDDGNSTSDEESDGAKSKDSRTSETPAKVNGLEQKSVTCVKNVRIIRDRATQLGKGIGYVELNSTHTLDLLLSLHRASPFKFKIGGRKLRLERCKKDAGPKTQPVAPIYPSGQQERTASTSNGHSRPRPSAHEQAARAVQLSHLSKEDRKLAKKADRDREARRADKKRRKLETRATGKAKADLLGRKTKANDGRKGADKGKDKYRPRK
ncbi:hypothetical protein DL96DRAFT_1731303 [Flagelloscypha sp. PMI_526]|nr:hypothetical protein DL96DRAFT_1731303 [Flagelloscypha sp. PMI_526]